MDTVVYLLVEWVGFVTELMLESWDISYPNKKLLEERWQMIYNAWAAYKKGKG